MMEQSQIMVISHDGISHAGTITPRLESSAGLIGAILCSLEAKRLKIEQFNEQISTDERTKLEQGVIQQRLVGQAIESLGKIQKKITCIGPLSDIPRVLSPAIPACNTLSSSLFGFMPECSQQLCRLSAGMAGIVVDSAILTNARCDFGEFNAESEVLLDEAKLMVDSKIDKQYPNLETACTDSI